MSILTGVSDARRNQDLERWIDGALPRLKSHEFTEEERRGFESVTGVEAHDEGAEAFRTFVDAGLLADWACYETSAERVDYERLRSVITSFPSGFRIWFCDVGPVRLPVGYTGYYPIAPEVFSTACDRPQDLKHRGALRPRPDLAAQRPPIWIFNYSIITQLRRSAQSKAMLGKLAADLSSTPNGGLAAAVLSDASKRVVGRFSMTYRGDMTHDGESENVYAFRA